MWKRFIEDFEIHHFLGFMFVHVSRQVHVY